MIIMFSLNFPCIIFIETFKLKFVKRMNGHSNKVYCIVYSTDQFCFNDDTEQLEILLGDLNHPYFVKKEVTLVGCRDTRIKLG